MPEKQDVQKLIDELSGKNKPGINRKKAITYGGAILAGGAVLATAGYYLGYHAGPDIARLLHKLQEPESVHFLSGNVIANANPIVAVLHRSALAMKYGIAGEIIGNVIGYLAARRYINRN